MGPRVVLVVGLIAALLLAGLLAAVGPVIRTGGPSPAGAPGDSGAGTAPVSTGVTTIAPGYSPSNGVHEAGPVNDTTSLSVAVGLEPRDESGLADYLVDLYTPGSSVYRQFLSPQVLASRYGATPADLSAALAYFRGFGLSAVASPDGLMVEVSGPAPRVGAAFDTSFEQFVAPGGRTFVSHLGAAQLPADLPWTGALGLGNATVLEPAAVASLGASTAVAGPAASGCSGGSPYSPCQIWTGYDLADDLANGTNGTGVTIGVVDTYDAAESQADLERDLADFDSGFDLPTPTVHYLYPVPTTVDLNATDTDWGLEEALDLEWAHATAPGATIDMTFAPNAGVGLYEAVDYLVANDLVNVLSLSWGEPDVGIYNAYEAPCSAACNASTDGSYAILSPVLEFAAAEGISVFAATGDCGASDGTSGVATNYPASDPYVTGVGGTDLDLASDGAYESETAWSGNSSGASYPGCDNQGGSGGGYSPFPRPYWQTGPGLTAGTTRADPDVSAVSEPGVDIVQGGTAGAAAGTSVATPIWAGIAAVADDVHGAPLGFLDPSLYAILDSARYTDDFHEITSGSNGYAAGPGWNPVTGIGSPIAGALIADLAGTPVARSTLAVSLNATVTYGPAPLSVTFFANATGGTGTYPITGVYFGDGTSGDVPAAGVAHVYDAPGVYAAEAYVWDSGANVSDSIPIAIVVGSGSTLSVGLVASTTAPAVGATVTLTAEVSGGTAPYTYDFSFGDGTFVNGSSSPVVDHAFAVAGGYCAVVIAVDSAEPPDGGESVPVAISAGGAPAPDCAVDRGAFALSAASDVPERDAPADFPDLFQLTGGLGTYSMTLVSTDPYIRACGCAIFRAAGTYPVTMFVNGTGTGPLEASTSVTVAPRLSAIFSVPTVYGPAPLTVEADATVSGGLGANATQWTDGDGHTYSGDSVSVTYADPGLYWLTGQVSDQGQGNASEAFLIDVRTTGVWVTATIGPVVSVPSATTINFTTSTSPLVPAQGGAFSDHWTLAAGGSSFQADFSRTFYAPATDPADGRLNGTLQIEYAPDGINVSEPFDFASLFAVEMGGFAPAADALVLTDSPGPARGAPPLVWTASAAANGPGTTGIAWDFGNGVNATGTSVTTTYASLGLYTATVEANDSFGDAAWDAHGVSVGIAPFALASGASALNGTAPFTVAFSAAASGGYPPYTYAWSFGDGTDSDVGNVSHTYASAGSYVATIRITDAVGEELQRTFTLNVSAAPAPPPRSPAAFSPLAEVALLGGAIAAVAAAVISIPRRRAPPSP